MKLFGGVSFEPPVLEVCFVSLSGRRVVPFQGFSEIFPNNDSNLSDAKSFLFQHIEDIHRQIYSLEKKYPSKIDSLYLRLPDRYTKKLVIEEIFPLGRGGLSKEFTYRDFLKMKRYIEEVSLGWEEKCLHHLILGGEIDGEKFRIPPLGERGRKLKLKSLIIFTSKQLWEECVSLFDAFSMRLEGFIHSSFSDFGAVSDQIENKIYVIINIQYRRSIISCFEGTEFLYSYEERFGEHQVYERIGQKFSLSLPLVEELVSQYGSFRENLFSKEITLRSIAGYKRLFSSDLNSILKEILREEIKKIFLPLKEKFVNRPIKLFFLGKLSLKEGFYYFVRSLFPYMEVAQVPFKQDGQSAFGCVRYGLFRPLEKIIRQESIWEKVIRIYKEYF